ncbi:unnamed protein product [Peronospora belbahrii]|uniref:RxLR effector protein n=1 Tax=Peronospora belbahrii TaxID=622444 RepID=A0AAU9LGD1_9STRA|nr:unnamed protein product [Peronospora belbahrii]
MTPQARHKNWGLLLCAMFLLTSGSVAQDTIGRVHLNDNVIADLKEIDAEQDFKITNTSHRTKQGEERGPGRDLWNKLKSSLLLKQSVADNLFEKHQLSGVSDHELFSLPQLEDWETAVVKAFNNHAAAHDAMVKALEKHFTHNTLLFMFENAKQDSDTQRLASALAVAQAMSWGKSGQTPETVFSWLQFDFHGNTILDNPFIDSWNIYVKYAYPDKNSFDVLFSVLKKHSTEVEQVKFLVNTKKDANAFTWHEPADKALDAKLDAYDQMSNGFPESIVYLMLGINDEPKPLKSPVIDKWASYVERKGKDPASLMFDILKTNSATENELAEEIVDALAGKTTSLANSVQKMLWKYWTENRCR